MTPAPDHPAADHPSPDHPAALPALSFPAAFSLAGETALITGGGTGIGLAIAEAMVAAGARVILTGRRAAPLAEAADRLGPSASFAVYDVTAYGQAEPLRDRLQEQFGPITCLVNNAGINLKKSALDTTPEDFDALLATNLVGAHALVRAFAPPMLARGAGSILYIASMASLFGIPKVIAYTATKAAVAGVVRGLATELSPGGVRVNAIAPGWIDTAMSRRAFAGDPARRDKILARTPLARLGHSHDIGWAAVFLASPAAAFLTGVLLPVDGGVSIGF